MFIDIHVHCRDGNQSYKETIEHALSVADRTGFSAIANMGNGNPATTNEETFLFYQDKADKVNSQVKFFQWILLTPEIKQIEKSIELWHKYPEIIGLKYFAGHSIGDTKIIERKQQRLIPEVLTKNNYRGIVIVHAEKEDFISGKFDPSNPISHCFNRPAIAEIASVSDILGDFLEEDYQGRLHFAHTSCPEVVQMRHRHPLKDRLSVGVGPHHLIMDQEDMKKKNGIYRKKNPPLRNLVRVVQLGVHLVNDNIDIYESDHAPHALKEKINEPYLSGFPQLPIIPLFIRELQTKFRMSDEQILNYMFNNVKKIFAPKLDTVEPRKDVSLSDLEELIKEVPKLRREYSYDAWEGIL